MGFDSGFGFGWNKESSDKKCDDENSFSTWADEEFKDLYSTGGYGTVRRFTFNDENESTFESIHGERCDEEERTCTSSVGNTTISFNSSHLSSKQKSSNSISEGGTTTPRSSPPFASSGRGRSKGRGPVSHPNNLRGSPIQSESVTGNSTFSARTEDSPTGVADFHYSERKKISFFEQDVRRSGLEESGEEKARSSSSAVVVVGSSNKKHSSWFDV